MAQIQMPSPSLAELQKQVEVLQEQVRNASSKAETFQEPARKKKGSAIGKENGTEEAEEDASGIDRKALGNHLRAALREAGQGQDPKDETKLVEWEELDSKVRTNAAKTFSLQFGIQQSTVASAMRRRGNLPAATQEDGKGSTKAPQQ